MKVLNETLLALPQNWNIKDLGTFCKVSSGGTPRRSNQQYFDGEIPWVKIGDMANWIITDTEEKITKGGLENSSAKIFPKNTVLISIFATIGSVSILGIDACTNQAIAGVIPDSKVADYRFLAYYLLSLKEKLAAMSRGVAQLNINQSILKSIKIPLPPLNEQRNIVGILERARRLQDERQQANQLTSKIIQSVFLKMFGDPDSNPMGWDIEEFGRLINSLRYGTSVKCSSVRNNGIPVLRIPNVIRGSLDLEDLKFAELNKEDLDRYSLHDGDLLFVRTNGNREYVGRCAVFHRKDGSFAFASYLIRARLKREKLDPDFVSVLFSFPSLRNQLFLRARTSAGQYNINTEGLKSTRVMLPPLDMQAKFTSTLENFLRLRGKQEESTTEISELFHSLMHKAFSGELTLKN